MAFFFGEHQVSLMHLGNQEIVRAYVGGDLVWDKYPLTLVDLTLSWSYPDISGVIYSVYVAELPDEWDPEPYWSGTEKSVVFYMLTPGVYYKTKVHVVRDMSDVVISDALEFIA